MCYHRRLIFGCNHHAWLEITKPCEVEEAFNSGQADTGCDRQWSHPFHVIRIQSKCGQCVKRQKGDNFQLGTVKDRIKAIKERLERIKGKKELPSIDTVLQESESGAKEGADDTSSLLEEMADTSDKEYRAVEEDPKHWPLKLPSIIAERETKEVDAVTL